MEYRVVILLFIVVCSAECSRILVVFPMPARSHYILGNSLARGLAEAGHDVTMVSPYEEKNPPKKGTYRDIVLTEFMKKEFDKKKFNHFEMGDMNLFLNIPLLNYFGNLATQETLKHPNFKKLLQSNEQFDVVIVEQFNNDALKVLAYHYKAPLIIFSTMGATSWVNTLVANPSPPSYVPEIFLSYTSKMTFKQRLVNWLFAVLSQLNWHLYFLPTQNKMMKEHFPEAPDLSILAYNVSLVFLNSHESINQPVPYVPNMIDIGGFHVNPPNELPKDLKDFMDNATEGVVYFSLGSNVQPSQMTIEKREAILQALAKIKQKVLWKWDEDTLPGQPNNVKLSKWFPQQDILAHPNTKLFITHGGLLSTIETVYHGIPVLAFPIYGDQKMNAAKTQAAGCGLSLPFSELTEEKITDALNRILNDSQYTQNAKRRSKLMHDRPVKPLDLAVYWTEFVIRHKGASHLRVAGLDLLWYKYLLLDVISFVVLLTSGSIFVFYILVNKLFCATKNNYQKIKEH